jgi:hypothetical protein
MVYYKRNKQIANSTNMELINISPNDENVVASNLNNIFYFFENCENQVQKQKSYVIFSRKCCGCLQTKTPHFIHLTNQYQMNKSFP